MTTNRLDTEISSRISSFLDELSQVVKCQALEAVQEALGGGAPRRGPGRPRKVTVRPGRRPRAMAKRAVKGKRIRRSSAQLAQIGARVLAQIRSKTGQRLGEIGRALKTDTAILKKPIADLLKAKKLRTTGAKRGMKYFVR